MKKGFTLIELITILAILGILGAIICGPINNARETYIRAKESAAAHLASDSKRFQESESNFSSQTSEKTTTPHEIIVDGHRYILDK